MTAGLMVCSVARAKLIEYLLNPEHPVGTSKARFFIQLGFEPARWEVLAEALREHADRNPVMKTEPTPFGLSYVVRCNLRTPNGRDPCILTVWQETGEGPGIVKLVTAYPSP